MPPDEAGQVFEPLRARLGRDPAAAPARAWADDRQDALRADGRRDDGGEPPGRGSCSASACSCPSCVPARCRLRGCAASATSASAAASSWSTTRRPTAAARQRARAAGLQRARLPAASGAGALHALLARAGRPTRCSWTWRCRASTAGETIRRIRHGRSARGYRDRLGQRLRQGGWRTTSASAPPTSSSSPCAWPSCWTGWAVRSRSSLGRAGCDLALRRAAGARRRRSRCRPSRTCARLQELVDIGYVRGIVKRLDQIEPSRPPALPSSSACARWRAASASTR